MGILNTIYKSKDGKNTHSPSIYLFSLEQYFLLTCVFGRITYIICKNVTTSTK